MKTLHQLARLFYIYYVLARHGVDRIIFSTPWLMHLRFLSWFNPWNWFNSRPYPRGVALRRTLEDLGPIFVKFGQIISTRQDLLPNDIILELLKLQDKVPPFSSQQAIQIITQSLNCTLSELFKDFSPVPLASASIAQVHAAVLHDGRQVVVKVLRPNIKKIIAHDIRLLYWVANITECMWSHGRRLRLRDLVKEFETTILNELDFLLEASNASQLRRNFQHSNLLKVPEVHWDYTSHSVFVMERIFGIPITDIAALNAAGVDLKKLAEDGVEIFFTQVFRDSFFHADMHPGNIFVSIQSHQTRYAAVDFGIMGSLSPIDQHYLAENLLAFFKRDYRRVALLHVESGWVPVGTRVEAFEAAIRSVCEPIFAKPLGEISFGQLLLRLFQTAGRFNMEIQPQLFLLQKTLLNIEGLGRKLYPELNLWTTAQPFLERWIRQRYRPKTILKKWLHQAPYITDQLLQLPELCRVVLQQQRDKQRTIQTNLNNNTQHSSHQRFKYILLGAGYTLGLIIFIVWFISLGLF